MPQAVAVAASAVKFIGSAFAAVSAGTATFAQTLAVAAINTAVSVGFSLALRPRVPDAEFARSVRKQTIPDRVSGYGRVRVGGAYMLYETAENDDRMAVLVYAMHDGLIDGWEVIYLNDRTVNIKPNTFVIHDADLRYSKNDDLVRIETRRGLPTETNYGQITSISPTYWPAQARLDGVASLMMIAQATEEHYARDYPNGLPLPSAVGRLQYCWDPRLGARGTINNDSDKQASATWAWTQNPFLQLLDYMTNAETGMGLPLYRFLPVIDRWVAAADDCDEPVPLEAGGTEPRYQAGGVYLHSTAPADVIATILATCDGWMAEDENGCFVVEAGVFSEPTVTLTDEHIISLQRQFWQADEQAVNEIIVSFTDPTKDYTEVEADPWRDQSEVDALGGVVRPQRLSLPWVQSNSQARRLAKIALAKSSVPLRGTITTTLEGLKAWGQRRIRIQAPDDSSTMADVVVDCLPLTLNPDLTVTIPWALSTTDAYDWNADDEGAGGGTVTPPPVQPLTVPIIDTIQAFQGENGTTRLRVFFDTAIVGLTYIIQWRETGEEAWKAEAAQVSVSGGGLPFVETGLVSPTNLDVQALQVGASGAKSEWSDTANVDASVTVAMGQPTNFSASGVGSTTGPDGASVEMAASAPIHDTVSFMRFYVGSSATFGSAAQVGPDVPVTSGEFVNYTHDVASPGFYYVWVQAFDATSTGSGPLGPIKVTIF